MEGKDPGKIGPKKRATKECYDTENLVSCLCFETVFICRLLNAGYRMLDIARMKERKYNKEI